MPELTHLSSSGEAKMVDIGQKPDTQREAVATGRVIMKPATLTKIKSASLKKGDALAVARVAGILAAKKTPDLIPLCHPILTNEIVIDFDLSAEDSIGITAMVKCLGKTGAEMEAMVACSIAALTIYDMGKSVDRGMTITDINLASKRGGKSGVYKRKRALP